jgi:hypothetical protein
LPAVHRPLQIVWIWIGNFEAAFYPNIENLVLWAMSDIEGFAVIQGHGVLE